MSEEKTHSVATPCSRARFSIAWRKPPIPQKRSINLRACAPKRSEPFCIGCSFANRGGEFKRNRVAAANFVVVKADLQRLVIKIEKLLFVAEKIYRGKTWISWMERGWDG